VNIAKEPASVPVGKIARRAPYVWQDGARGLEIDIGDYQVCLRWDWLGAELPSTTCAMLQICRADGGSVVDWRHLQEIKNLVCGPEWEAVELFPAESRLKDPSNARYLWACKDALPFGLPGGRMVLDAHESIAPQRPFTHIDEAINENVR
jgi:hypothetical protein